MNALRSSAVWLPSVLVSAVLGGGCAARQEGLATGGARDERREEIARLDHRIAQEEAELGIRPPPAPEVDAEAEATAGAQGEMTTEEAPAMPQPSPPPPSVTRQPSPPAQPGHRFAEPPAAPPSEGSCHRVCRSVAAICDASSRICRLADGLDDAWADGRCQAATRSCTSAEQRAQSRCAGSCS